MHQRLIVLFVIIFMSVAALMGQTLTITPYGASPAKVLADTVGNPHYLGILDRVYSAMLNVGVETQMYFKGTKSTQLLSPAWTVKSAPAGSAASVTVTVNVDTSNQVAIFTPDVVGTYILEFADGSLTAEVTINAGTYLGVEAGAVNCKMCHKGKYDEWMGTGHYDIFYEAMTGTLSNHYSNSCVSCHTTGYDLDADNQGFDDRTQLINGVDSVWAYPDSLAPGTWDALWALYPNSMQMSRIQCESCHGPGSAHNGVVSNNKMESSLEVGVCATCHDDNHYHVYPSQWESSAHSDPPYRASWSSGCANCHTGTGFVQFAKGETVTSNQTFPITCAACHDPHSAENAHQVRLVTATLTNGEVVPDNVGTGGLCMNCHKSRRDAATYTNASGSHYGPHYATQADILIGTNVVTFGKKLPTSAHLASTGDACVTCHMYESGAHGEHDAEGNLTTAGMHSFSMVSKDGVDNVAACQDCHGNIGTSFGDKKFYMNGVADHDGDGVEEGLQDEVHGLMEEVGALLPASDPHAETDNTWTLTELKAAYNHRMVYYDHSYGIHNPAFTVALLKVSMAALVNGAVEGEIVAIDDVPNDQGKQVKIIWDKFVDDGLGVDPVEKYIVKRFDGDSTVWTGVGEHTADGSARYALVVPTLFDSTADGANMTQFKVVALTQGGAVHESVPADGYSVDNLIPQAPKNFNAKLAGGTVNLSWEETGDPDVNYYRLFRSTDEGFVPSEANAIGTTTSLEFVDDPATNLNYFYKVVAVDFSGNQGALSTELNVNLTSIRNDGGVPQEFALSQNYPNPFNPTTQIDFAIKNNAHVTLTVYNSIGQEVRTLMDQELTTGVYSVSFDGTGLSSGVYFYRIQATGSNGEGMQFNAMHKMLLMK